MEATYHDFGMDRARSVSAFVDAAYQAHAPALLRAALRTTRDPERAADVVQESFLRLFVEAQAGRVPENAGAWLYRTGRNLVVSEARHAEVQRRFAPSLARLDGPDEPELHCVDHEGRETLVGQLARLQGDDRAVLLLAAAGATGGEIAHRLGVSHGAARTRLSRARSRLRRSLDAVDTRRRREAVARRTRGPERLVTAAARE